MQKETPQTECMVIGIESLPGFNLSSALRKQDGFLNAPLVEELSPLSLLKETEEVHKNSGEL
ncbi:hypothetical protein KI387_041728, partial [Taxus chinensis]